MAAGNSMNGENHLVPRRLFFGIMPPDYIRGKLMELRTADAPLSWIAPERLHLTLRFFGETDYATAETLIEEAARFKTKRFMLEVGGVGVFPGMRNPRVLHAGLGSGHPHLFGLQTQLENLAVGLGFEVSGSRYTPHITVARCGPGAQEAVRQWLKEYQDFASAPFLVDRFLLLQSRSGPGGVNYQPVAAFPLE